MKTLIEHLPVELWMSVFAYFEAHELLRAFTNLNEYFSRLIASDYLLFKVRLGKNDQNPLEYSTKPYWSNSILNRVLSLQPIRQHKTSHIPEFLRWHCSELIQLKFLKVKLRGRAIPTFSFALSHLHSLQSLSLECVPNQLLLEAILSAPTLRMCRLDFLRPVTPIKDESNHLSNVKILHIKLEDNSYGSVLNILLSHMPRLQSLQMNNTDIYVNNREWIFSRPLFILPELRTIKMTCSSNYSSPIIFENLHRNLPTLECLDLQISFDFISQDLLDHFIHHWWPVFEEIETIKIFLRCRNYSIMVDQHAQIDFHAFRVSLLAQNELVKVQYIEKFLFGSRIVEILICK